MKKKIGFLLLVPAVFALASCGEGIIPQATTTKDSGLETTTIDDSGNDETTTLDDGSEATTSYEQGGIITQSGEYDTLNNTTEIMEAIGSRYYITVKVDTSYTLDGTVVEDSVSYTTVSDGNYAFWARNVDDSYKGSLYKKNYDDSLICFEYDDEAKAYNELLVYTGATNPFSGVKIIFPVNEKVYYDTKDSVEFVGRECTKYVYREASKVVEGSYDYTDEYIFDNETGACLKFHRDFNGEVAGATSVSATGNFEVTTFDRGTACDTFLDKVREKITINEWDTTIFEKLGLAKLDGSSYVLNEIVSQEQLAKFQLREASNDVYEDTGNGSYNLTYFIKETREGGASLGELFVENFYNCGAKYAFGGEAVTSVSDLCNTEVNDDNVLTSLSFEGYPTDGDPYISVNYEWEGAISGGVWKLYIDIYYKNN